MSTWSRARQRRVLPLLAAALAGVGLVTSAPPASAIVVYHIVGTVAEGTATGENLATGLAELGSAWCQRARVTD
ncbi:MAG: hypothetical protein ACYDAD_10405 [Acidimicrobiales bacterium]